MSDDDLQKILLNSNLMRQEELNRALDEMRKLKRPLEKVIVDMHILSLSALYEIISNHLGIQYVHLDNLKPDDELVKLIPEAMARKTQSVPLKIDNNILHVAMAEPSDLYTIDQIQMQACMPVEAFLSSPVEIEEAQHKIYIERAMTQDIMNDLVKPESESKITFSGGVSVVKLVDLIVAQAVHDKASDIHIEPEQDILRIRFRIDGILHEVPSPPKDWEPAIISRIKVLSNMDIAETRVPQDGHFQSKVDESIIDFRVSTMPTIYGENLVMRILDTSSVMIGLDKLGFSTFEELKRYESMLSRPYGIILSTGPTGSGKTTTLYSALMRINTVDRNIITIEDPVEYRLGLIRQIQINPKAGITFAAGLRAILRQDPDVIMVGEIRDLETAVIAVQSSLTGHLVFSTLHTNDAPSAVTRLVNMGVEPFLISASLIGVMAQRLIRVICSNCKESYEPSKAMLAKWGLQDKEGVMLYRGKGCDKCKGSGFKGRTGLYELMAVDDEIREMILAQASTIALRKKAQEKGMRLLSEDGLAKCLAGITTIEEVSRVCEDRVDLKTASAAVELKRFISTSPVSGPAKVVPPAVEVKESDVAEYQKRIAQWLTDKK